MSDKTELDLDAGRAAAKRYRFLLLFLLDRGVLHQYDNGIWRLRGIYGVDDSGLKGAGRTPEEALDNAIVAVNLDQASADKFWRESCEAVLAAIPSAPVAAAQADAAREARNEALLFAERIISDALQGADWDGDAVQELAVKHGLLKPQEMTAPCGEDGHCACAQNGAEFPALCYRKTYLAALRATPTEGQSCIAATKPATEES